MLFAPPQVLQKPSAQAVPLLSATTPSRDAVLSGLGLGTIDHAVPSQCSTSVPVPVEPTAQAVSPGPAVASEMNAPGMLGMETGDQAVPFQRSISGWLLRRLMTSPIAQALRPGPAMTEKICPDGMGVCSTA